MNIQRNSGTQLNKVFISHNSQYPFLFADGSLVEFGMHLNIGGYKIQNYNDPLTGVFKEDYFRSQIYPQTTLSISKPFYKINKGTKKIIEPRFFFLWELMMETICIYQMKTVKILILILQIYLIKIDYLSRLIS